MNFICVINVSSKGACASRLPPQKLTKYYHFHNLRVCWVLYAPAGSRGYAPKHSIFFSAVCHLGPILRLLSSLNFSIILCVHPSLHACTKNNLEEKERFFIANQETANKPEIIPKPKHCHKCDKFDQALLLRACPLKVLHPHLHLRCWLPNRHASLHDSLCRHGQD